MEDEECKEKGEVEMGIQEKHMDRKLTSTVCLISVWWMLPIILKKIELCCDNGISYQIESITLHIITALFWSTLS